MSGLPICSFYIPDHPHHRFIAKQGKSIITVELPVNIIIIILWRILNVELPEPYWRALITPISYRLQLLSMHQSWFMDQYLSPLSHDKQCPNVMSMRGWKWVIKYRGRQDRIHCPRNVVIIIILLWVGLGKFCNGRMTRTADVRVEDMLNAFFLSLNRSTGYIPWSVITQCHQRWSL